MYMKYYVSELTRTSWPVFFNIFVRIFGVTTYRCPVTMSVELLIIIKWIEKNDIEMNATIESKITIWTSLKVSLSARTSGEAVTT